MRSRGSSDHCATAVSVGAEATFETTTFHETARMKDAFPIIEYVFRFFFFARCFGDKTKMVGLMFLVVIFASPSVLQQCSRPVRSIKGKYLSGHVVLNGSADGVGDCLVNCSLNPRCKSINFRYKDLLCELNEADRHTHPRDYVPKEGHAYSDYPFKVISPLRAVARDKL